MDEYSVVIHPVMARELAGKTTNTTQIEKFKNRTATFSHEIMKKVIKLSILTIIMPRHYKSMRRLSSRNPFSNKQ